MPRLRARKVRDVMPNANPLSRECPDSGSESCDEARAIMVDLGMGESRRREIAAGVAHLESCVACNEALLDYDRIQSALRDKSGQTAAEPHGGWEAFGERLRHGLIPQPKVRPAILRWLRPVSALAAGVLLTVGGFVFGTLRGPRPAHVPGSEEPMMVASFSKDDVSRQMRAFGEVDQVFEGRTRWLLLTSGGADMALDDMMPHAFTPTESGKEKIVLLRLNLSRAGEVVSTADVLIVAGRTAEIRLPMKDGTSLRYRLETSLLDPAQLGLRAELGSADGIEPKAALATDLQLSAERGTSAGQLIAPSGRYDVKVLFASASH
jgi:hypothetical protein